MSNTLIVKNKSRNSYFDLLRGIAIIFVIAIHSHGAILDSLDVNTLRFHSSVVWRQFIGCAVPIFLAISGYFLSRKEVSTKETYRAFIQKQIPKVYIPVLVWSFPYLIYSIYTGSGILKSLTLFFICGFSVYYFILLIMQYYFLLPLLQKIGRSKRGLICSAIISGISILCFTYIDKIQGIGLPLVVYAGPFTMWIVFFVLGVYIGTHKETSRKQLKVLLIIIALSLGISVAETYLYFHITGSYSGQGIKFGAFVYSFVAILLLFYFSRIKMNSLISKVLVYIGELSFGIYLIHLFVLSAVRRYVTINWGGQVVHILLTLTICVLIIFISKKINYKFAKKYLGF